MALMTQLTLPGSLLHASMGDALTGVYTDPGSACQSPLPSASPVLAAAASWKGHCLPEVADEGKLLLLNCCS